MEKINSEKEKLKMEISEKSEFIETPKLFETKKEFSSEEIRQAGRYPLLETLVILKSPDEEVIKETKEEVFQKTASAFLFDPSKLMIKDANAFGKMLTQMLKEGAEKGALEINKALFERPLLAKGYKSLDEFPPEKREELETMRTLCQTIIDNRDLLDRCVKPFPKCGWTLKDHLPLLVKDIALRVNLNLSEEEIKDCADSFVNIKNLTESKECQEILNYYDPEDPDWQSDSKRKNIYGILCEYANSYFQTEYVLEELSRAKEIIKLYYPEIFKDLPAKVMIQYLPHFFYDVEKKYCISEAEENAAYNREELCLKVRSKIPLNNRRNYGEMETINPFDKEKSLRKNNDLIGLTHEYLHYLVIDSSKLPDDFLTPEGVMDKKYYKTPYMATLEGVSVFLEMLTEDFLIRDAAKLGLTIRDIEDLKNLKNGRLRSLKEHGRALRSMWKEMEIMKDPQKREQQIREWEKSRQYLEKTRPADVCPRDYSEQPKIQELEKLIERFNNPIKVQKYIERCCEDILRKNIYYEGTLKILHKLYKNKGLSGILNFIKNLDAEKIVKIDRTGPEYKDLLDNPDLLIKAFTKDK